MEGMTPVRPARMEAIEEGSKRGSGAERGGGAAAGASAGGGGLVGEVFVGGGAFLVRGSEGIGSEGGGVVDLGWGGWGVGADFDFDEREAG